MKTLLRAAALFLALAASAEAKVLTACVEGSPDVFNPELSNSGTTIYVLDQIYDGLISVKPGSSALEPALASSWDVSADAKTYTFHLRQGVKWQSNAAFTPTRDMNADDVLFTFQRMMDKSNPYYRIGGNYPTFNAKLASVVASIEKIDDHTVAFHLTQPTATFLGTMAHGSLGITSKEYADALLKAGRPADFDRNPIGTGPFSLQAYQPDSMVRLLAFHDTWGERIGDKSRTPLVDVAVLAISPDASVRLQRALAGECDIARYPNLADRDTIEHSSNLRLVRAPVASTGFLHFNFRRKPLQDIRVRKALAEAIDIQSLVKAVYSGLGRVTGAIVPPALWASPDIPAYKYDPDDARKLLQDAGYASGLKLQLWAIPVVRPYMPEGRHAAEMIQADWAKIGVQAQIVSYEWAEYISRATSGEADVAEFGGIYDFPDPSQIMNNYFTCSADGKPSPSNLGAWCNDKFEGLMQQAERITDQAQREKLYDEAQEVFHQEVPAVVLGGADALTAVNKAVVGYVPAVFGSDRLAGVTGSN